MIISWWSAGVTSAVATKLAIQEFGDELSLFILALTLRIVTTLGLKSSVKSGMVAR